MITFLLNNQKVNTQQPPGMTVLDFVRYKKRLPGTKIGCREGDCGACTILVGELKNEELQYRNMTSCLMPLQNAHGKHILTVEGINMKAPSPVQQQFIATNGTQCGFCTIGFVMSLTGYVLEKEEAKLEGAVAAMDGNICRCTGYKSIERAAVAVTDMLKNKPEMGRIEWLVEKGFLPEYFLEVKTKLNDIRKGLKSKEPSKNIEAISISGGTDLVVQKPEQVKKAQIHSFFDNVDMKGIQVREGKVFIGSATTVTEFGESPLLQKVFPELKNHLKLIASTPIRNMATLGGNIVNASPIGDMSIFLLALDASLVLNLNDKRRTIKIKDFFKGYKTLDKAPDEHIEEIIFELPNQNDYFNFEKVSKRTHLDIASVNSACFVKLSSDNSISEAHLSAGGVAPIPKYLQRASSFLKGKQLSQGVILKAIELINEEVAPISDARGSKEYKRLLLRQLFIGHLQQMYKTIDLVNQPDRQVNSIDKLQDLLNLIEPPSK